MKVITNTAITLDGKIASHRFDHVAIGSADDRRYMSVLRARADAILVGGRTFRNWPLALVPDPRAIERLAEAAFPDVDVPSLEGRTWWNVVLSRTMAVPTTGAFYGHPRTRPLFYSPVARAPEADVVPAEVVVGEVDLHTIVADLATRGVETLLVEAGGALIYSFLEAGLVDEMYVTICPSLLGGAAAPTLVDGAGFNPGNQRSLVLVHANVVGSEIYTRYLVNRSEP